MGINKNNYRNECKIIILYYSMESYQCPICLEQVQEEEQSILNCNHIFCKKCIDDYIKQKKILVHYVAEKLKITLIKGIFITSFTQPSKELEKIIFIFIQILSI